MAITVSVIVADCGASTNTYNIYYDYAENEYLLKTDVQCDQLLAGYEVNNVPDTATSIIVAGVGSCVGVVFTIPLTPVTPSPTPTSNLDCSFAFTVIKTP